jgi:Patatin-like phospholipase
MGAGGNSKSREARLHGPGAKRILSIDAAGPRGMLATGLLAAIEARLARRSGARDFRLCDYFDLIGGASTGALIATALAMGKSAAEIAQIEREIAPSAFSGAGAAKPRFDSERLDAALKREFGEHELGSPALRCGLALFAKRADTGAIVSFASFRGDAAWEGQGGAVAHRRLILRRLARASMAGQDIAEMHGVSLAPADAPAAEAQFVDAGLAGLADPSLSLLQMATLAQFGLNWEAREDRLLLISVGAGAARAPRVGLESIAQDAARAALATLQSLSEPAKPWRIDDELGDMQGARLAPWPLLCFQRFDVRLDDAAALKALGVDVDATALPALREAQSSDGGALAKLHELGKRAGEAVFAAAPGASDCEARVFPPRFNPPGFGAGRAGAPGLRIAAMARAFGAKDLRD